MNKVVIGIDAGTTAVKAVAFSLEGEILETAHGKVPIDYGRHGEAEQDMDAIWDAVADCLTTVTGALGEATIVGVGVTGQGDGAWLLDTDGRPLRQAALWLDGRAGDRVTAWQEDGRADYLLNTTGAGLFPGLAPVLLEEYEEQAPGFLKKVATIFYCKDWVRFKLTGQIATDYTEASRNFLDIRQGKLDPAIAERVGLSDVMGALPELLEASAVGGQVTAAAAARTGLPEGIPVSVGMIDVSVTGPGLGAVNDGDSWLILGTTGFIGTLRPSIDDRTSMNSMVLANAQNQVLESFAPMTGTPNLDWIRTTLKLEDWSQAEAEARSVRPGSAGVVYLPYASPGGERAPFLDPAASASWLGMSISTTPAEILRSVYEGVSFSLVECVEALQLEGELVVSGGGFRSDLICEIVADTTGKTVVRQEAPEAGARGAATLALVASGEAVDVKAAASMMVTSTSPFEPNPNNYAIYRQAFDVFTSSRDAIRPVWPAMRSLRAQSTQEDDK